MITTKDNIILDELDQNKPIVIRIRNKKFKIRAMGSAIADRFDRYASAAYVEREENGNPRFNFSNDRSLACKCVSLMVLHGFLRVTLFHQLHWRVLYKKYNQQEIGAMMDACMQRWDASFFLKNMLCLEQNSRMITRIKTQSSASIVAELKLEQETT